MTHRILAFEQLSFVTESHYYRTLPADAGREVAFMGRSNSGKSSLINALARKKRLAITSRMPGRTRGIVVFSWPNSNLRLVDLPGYGYARTDAKTLLRWHTNMNAYVNQRKSLVAFALLVDCRRQFSDIEADIVANADRKNQQIILCLTKADKINKNEQSLALRRARQFCDELKVSVQICLCSVKHHATVAQLRRYISACLVAETMSGKNELNNKT